MSLPSGLPEHIEGDEDIARFLTSSGHYNSTKIRPSAYMPNPANGETSVFRHGAEPLIKLKAIAQKEVGESRTIHGAAIVQAEIIHKEKLELRAKEPPPRHADIVKWPWIENDRAYGKAEQKELAAALAQKATRLIFD